MHEIFGRSGGWRRLALEGGADDPARQRLLTAHFFEKFWPARIVEVVLRYGRDTVRVKVSGDGAESGGSGSAATKT